MWHFQLFSLSLLVPLVFCANAKGQIEFLSKTSFCRAFSSCRLQAQLELGQCAGGILPALAAKQGMPMEGGDSRKCIWEMNRTLGNSLGALYERIERRALKCAEQHSLGPGRALNRDELLACKALHVDFLSSSSSPLALLALRGGGQQFEDPSGPQECVQMFDVQLLRCDALNRCCPELDGCLRAIEEDIEIRAKEVRVLKLLDKCMNEVPVKSAEVQFVQQLGEEGGNGSGMKFNVDPVPVPIVASTTSSSSSPPSSSTEPIPSSPSSSSTLLPPPDPTMRDFLNLFFPGLAINGERRRRKEMEAGEGEASGRLAEIVPKMVDQGGGGGAKEKKLQKVDNPPVENPASAAFVVEPNAVDNGGEEEEDGDGEVPMSTNMTATSRGAISQNGTKHLSAYSRTDRLLAMAVGRIFCHNYAECVGVNTKLGANCSLREENSPKGGGIHSNWFTFEQMGKCLEARPLDLLASSFGQSSFCPIAEKFRKSCRLLRECCPSIV